VGIVKKEGTKTNLLMDFLSKGKFNVNMGRRYGNPKMKSFGSMTCLMNLPHEMKVFCERGRVCTKALLLLM